MLQVLFSALVFELLILLQNGKFAVVGTYDGRCIFYNTDQLKYYTMIHVRSTRGKNKQGRKVTGIEPMPGEDKVEIMLSTYFYVFSFLKTIFSCEVPVLDNNVFFPSTDSHNFLRQSDQIV